MRVLSGIQPSGELHIGNYFGSIRPNLEWMGKADENLFFIADLHALTTVHDAETLRRQRRAVVLVYLACGFDPEKAMIFLQSDVPEHTELMWVLATVTPMGLLERAVSYKEKVEKGIAASAGLFSYPVLMAADILLYDADLVPVGKDQKQHIEIARDMALKFNHIFGDTLVPPEPQIREEVAVVPGVDGQKMSKSYGNTVSLFGDEKAVKKAIMGIVTDSKAPDEPKDPEATLVYKIHRLFLDEAAADALAEDYRKGIGYGDAKKRLLETCMDVLVPLRARRAELEKNVGDVSEVLVGSTNRARTIASATMDRVRKAVGLR